MPAYEVALIVRNASQHKLKETLKGACQDVLKNGGLIKKIENLGQRELPHPISANQKLHREGHYFCIQMDCATEKMKDISKCYKETKPIIRFGVVVRDKEFRRPCLDGPCLFGELQNADHDRTAYTRKVLTRFKNRKIPNV